MLFCLVRLQWNQSFLSKLMTAPQHVFLIRGQVIPVQVTKCFKSAFHTGQLQEIQCIKVENASGKSMEPISLWKATVTLGPKDFSYTSIVC